MKEARCNLEVCGGDVHRDRYLVGRLIHGLEAHVFLYLTSYSKGP